jgi:O-antigen ligase
MTVLARMGVPGLAIWVAFLFAFAVAMFRGFLDARTAGDDHRARVIGWLLLYWLAMLVNTSFDPYLESPMGGIWFWCVIGYGLALVSGPAARWSAKIGELDDPLPLDVPHRHRGDRG